MNNYKSHTCITYKIKHDIERRNRHLNNNINANVNGQPSELLT